MRVEKLQVSESQKRELETVRNRIGALETDKQKAAADLAKVNDSLTAREKERTTLKFVVEELRASLEEKKSEVEFLTNKANKMTTELKDAKRDLENARHQVASLEQELEQAKAQKQSSPAPSPSPHAASTTQ